MTIDQYYQMCEQMGIEPREEDTPIDPSTLSDTGQQTLVLLNSLPDIWEGMSGSWMGKDYSGLGAIMDIYEISDRKAVFELLKVAENEMSKYYSEKQKQNQALAKSKRG